MARDDKEDRYKEGVDFEWVKAKGSNYRTRRFFSKAEKRARAEKKETAKAATDDKPTGSTKSAPETSPRPKPRPKRKPEPTRGPDDGSRGGQTPNPPRRNPKSGASRSTEGKVRPRLSASGSGTPSDPMTQTGSLKIPDRNSSGSVPTSNPHRALALQRREDERRARAEAEAQGGRVSPLGRMIDRVFGGRNETQVAKNKDRSSKRTGGLNKGGLVDTTNKGKVGASMAPTQKKFKTQTRTRKGR